MRIIDSLRFEGLPSRTSAASFVNGGISPRPVRTGVTDLLYTRAIQLFPRAKAVAIPRDATNVDIAVTPFDTALFSTAATFAVLYWTGAHWGLGPSTSTGSGSAAAASGQSIRAVGLSRGGGSSQILCSLPFRVVAFFPAMAQPAYDAANKTVSMTITSTRVLDPELLRPDGGLVLPAMATAASRDPDTLQGLTYLDDSDIVAPWA